MQAASRDLGILYATAFVRATATGLVGVLVGFYLATLGLGAQALGAVVAAGLAGAAAAAFVATLAADRHGRRRMLIEVALLGAAGGLALAASSSPVLLGVVAFLGMLNGMGRDRGAALVIEQAILPSTVTDEQRTRALAWYNVLQDAGHAVGALLAGLPRLLDVGLGLGGTSGERATLVLYALLFLVSAALYRRLSPDVEERRSGRGARLSQESRARLGRISALFALDGLAGGLLTTALLSYFFLERFHVDTTWIAALFAAARVMNAASHLVAARLARRIGLVNTMVFTHAPSSLLLVAVAYVESFPVAAALFLLREALVEMDVPTRQSYVLAMVRPEERMAASGVTNLVRMAAWAAAPAAAGLFMQRVSMGTPLVLGAAMKIAYDSLLYVSFRSLRPPEEVRR